MAVKTGKPEQQEKQVERKQLSGQQRQDAQAACLGHLAARLSCGKYCASTLFEID